jgi:hypothetical protein
MLNLGNFNGENPPAPACQFHQLNVVQTLGPSDHTVVKDGFARIIQFKASNGDSLKIEYEQNNIKQIRNRHGSPMLDGSEKNVQVDEVSGAVEIDFGGGESEMHYVGSSSIYTNKDGGKEVIISSGAVYKFEQTDDGCDVLTGVYTTDGRYFQVSQDSVGNYKAECTVRPGDSLYRIAEDWLTHTGMLLDERHSEPMAAEGLRKAVRSIAEINGIDAPGRIYAGQKLSIPATKT